MFGIFFSVPPLYVQLKGLNHPLVAGMRTQISCSSAGARPPPQILWSKGGVAMRGPTQTVSCLFFLTKNPIAYFSFSFLKSFLI